MPRKGHVPRQRPPGRPPGPERKSVCIRLSPAAGAELKRRAEALGITSGEVIERLLAAQAAQ